MYMGGRHSYWRPQRLPKSNISIPNFPYPKFIFSYLMSQSAIYNIKFTTPNGDSGKVDMPPDEPQAATTSPISSTAAPTVTPAPTTRPAFSTGLTSPPGRSSGSGRRAPLPRPPYVQPGVPAFWVAAIWAMAFVNDIGPIDDYETLTLFYSSVASKMKDIMEDGSDGAKNVGALIYFCTTTSILFEPFMPNFTYNYLNVYFPKIFNDTESISGASKYTKFVMVNYYSVHAADILKPNRYPGNGYIPFTEQKVIKYAVPDILKSILDVLNDAPPLTGL
jgi:hypothetical protein